MTPVTVEDDITSGERRRWDTDIRHRGISDAGPLAGAVTRLREACTLPEWVTEDADAHLGPHLRRGCEAPGSPWRWVGAAQHQDGVYSVELEHESPDSHRAYLQAVALLAEVAEASFLVRRVDELTVDCVTGMLPGDGQFATHGHTVRLHLRPSHEEAL